MGLEVLEGISIDVSSKRVSWLIGFLFDVLEGLSESPGFVLPLNPDSELHSFEESIVDLKIQDLAFMMPGIGASSASKSNSSILGGISRSSRARLKPIRGVFLIGDGL